MSLSNSNVAFVKKFGKEKYPVYDPQGGHQPTHRRIHVNWKATRDPEGRFTPQWLNNQLTNCYIITTLF
jgi:hypothetical protein